MKGDTVLRMSFEPQQKKEPLIVFEAVGKTFNTKAGERVEAIRDVSFTVARNEFVTIVGPSGCGKSTLLKMLAGLLAPTKGRLTVQGARGPRAVRCRNGFSAPSIASLEKCARQYSFAFNYHRDGAASRVGAGA